jgi:hypothetical protein
MTQIREAAVAGMFYPADASELRCSGDTVGGWDQVLGYGSWLFEEGGSCDMAA